MGAVTGEHMDDHVVAGEEEFSSDSEAFSSVYYVLDSVRKEPKLVDTNDKAQYDYLLSIVDPTARFGPEEEALLTTVLIAMAQAVSRIDTSYHQSLLSNVFKMRIWFFGFHTRTALLELITTLAAVPDKFLEGCLHMLVSNFVPPERVLWRLDQPNWVFRKRMIHQELHTCLQYIFQNVPLAAFKLSGVLDETMPRRFDSKAKMNAYVECMLGLQREEIGDVLSAILLSKVINLLSDLDVNITWNDVHQEDETMGIFDMELEDLDNQCLQFAEDDSKVGAPFNNRGFNGNNNCDFVDKLDGLMVVVCEHLNSRVESGHLLTDYNMFMDIFRTSVLRLHKSKFTQVLMYLFCSFLGRKNHYVFAVAVGLVFFGQVNQLKSFS